MKAIRCLLVFLIVSKDGVYTPCVLAHVGDKVFPFFEITDENLSHIDLKDGSIEDWETLFGEATIGPFDFHTLDIGDGAEYDPADLDFRLWLGWNGSTHRIYVAMERTDNFYVNKFDRSPTASRDDNQSLIFSHDSSIQFLVDGDHGGEPYYYDTSCCDQDEWRLMINQKAQWYAAIGETPDGDHVELLGTESSSRRQQAISAPPYAEGGGRAFGEHPAISITEFYVTPFDFLIWNQLEGSRRSELFPGKVIGFQLFIPDFDVRADQRHASFILPPPSTTGELSAAFFTDGILLGAQGSDSQGSAVEHTSWAHIKVSR
jgi:hypothetical protein